MSSLQSFASLGPYCQAAGITEIQNIKLPVLSEITTGLALELKNACDAFNYSDREFVSLLGQLNSGFVSVSAAVNKLKYHLQQKKKLQHKKKVKGYKNVKELLDSKFIPPETRGPNQISEKLTDSSTVKGTEQQITQTPLHTKQKHMETQTEKTENDGSQIKDFNLLKYKHSVLEKKNKLLTNKINAKRVLLQKVEGNVGHYSVRNVNKRDETARKNLHLLRDSQRKVLQQNKTISKFQSITLKLSSLQKENNTIRKENTHMNEQFQVLKDKCDMEKEKKIALQKANSYLRGEVGVLRTVQTQCYCESSKNDDEIKKLKLELTERDRIISEMEEELAELQNSSQMQTKDEHGYTDNIRLCVIELAGLEVSTEKISPAIQVVAKHVCKKEIPKNLLPNATTAQRTVDEGQYLAKAYIADRLEHAENWGLGRDGTTRRKEKIIDTAITLDSGENISLGFSRVARETADTIQLVTEEKLKELAEIKENSDYLSDTLQKLAFTMSDRASNEKKADQLLDEWRENVLKEYGGSENEVHHLHCMAHVLLGLHNYVTPAVKELEKSLQSENGPIGRDSMSFFNTWNESIVSRVVRTTSDIFGPAGDHRGVRDRWEAFCSEHGLKSHIGNYRDNRFNALFQTSAEIFLHRSDFIKVLDTVSKPNMKLKSVRSDLESKEVCALLQCLGLFYLKLTGPFWNVITCGKVPYLKLDAHIEEIDKFLVTCEQAPEHLLLKNEHWSSSDPLEIGHVTFHDKLSEKLFVLDEETRDLLCRMIPIVCSAMLKCFHKQLVDFYPGGKFHGVPEDECNLTSFAPVTNLSCEHHFGDLDSSQRRRPNASYYHHTLIQLLKRNRNKNV